MKKLLALTVIISLLGILLISCKPYGNPMYTRLSNPGYYKEFSVIVEDIEYWDADVKKMKEYSPDILISEEDTVYITARPDSRETYAEFYGGISEDVSDEIVNEYRINLKICKANNDILIANGFYDEISVGDTISAWSTYFVYFDVTHSYMAGVKTESKTYLDFDEGLSNVVKMMDVANDKWAATHAR